MLFTDKNLPVCDQLRACNSSSCFQQEKVNVNVNDKSSDSEKQYCSISYFKRSVVVMGVKKKETNSTFKSEFKKTPLYLLQDVQQLLQVSSARPSHNHVVQAAWRIRHRPRPLPQRWVSPGYPKDLDTCLIMLSSQSVAHKPRVIHRNCTNWHIRTNVFLNLDWEHVRHFSPLRHTISKQRLLFQHVSYIRSLSRVLK